MNQRGLRLLAKRAFDVTVASAAVVATAPVIAGAAAAIWWTMGSPVLFRQDRVGRGDRIFRLIKFRTMKNGPPDAGPDSDHLRITPFGQWLRDTSIDELPQLYNILKGDMSLVGPRPLLVRYLPRYNPRQRHRHDVLPGLTGWAQVNGRNGLTWDQKFEHDVWYVEHWSLRLDIEIIARTAWQVVRRDGINAGGHASMPEFMGSTTTLEAGDP